ncbi:MAG: hypothetical protein SGBAC_005749 [Bacillariaceae sp.]
MSKRRLLQKIDGLTRTRKDSSAEFMREKYPSAKVERPVVVEYYKLNDLGADSVRLPPRLPVDQSGKANQDPRFTSSFNTLKDSEKREILESYTQEVRWFLGKVSKDVVFASEIYPLHVAVYRIFSLLQEDPFYQFDTLSTDDRKLLFDCCVEWFMRHQQEHAERVYLHST